MLGTFHSDTATRPIAGLSTGERFSQIEKPGDCPQCDNLVRPEDVVITSPRPGLGKPRKQHVEAHCRHCRHVIVFNREFTGQFWQMVGTYQLVSEENHTAAMRKRRANLEHGVTREDEFSGSEELSHDSNGGA